MEDKIFASKGQIDRYTRKCARHISEKYRLRTTSSPIVLLGVLNGAMPFLTNLSFHIDENVPVMIDTIRCKSYSGMFQRSKVKITKKPEIDLNNKTVIVVEDIVDSGETITEIRNFLNKKYQNINIEICALFKRSTYDLYLEYLGRTVPQDAWIYGYGMDNDQFDRNLSRVMIKSNV